MLAESKTLNQSTNPHRAKWIPSFFPYLPQSTPSQLASTEKVNPPANSIISSLLCMAVKVNPWKRKRKERRGRTCQRLWRREIKRQTQQSERKEKRWMKVVRDEVLTACHHVCMHTHIQMRAQDCIHTGDEPWIIRCSGVLKGQRSELRHYISSWLIWRWDAITKPHYGHVTLYLHPKTASEQRPDSPQREATSILSPQISFFLTFFCCSASIL